ncbi:MAG: hypothetical protein RLP44_26685 [Aggregatilineales bacterium]
MQIFVITTFIWISSSISFASTQLTVDHIMDLSWNSTRTMLAVAGSLNGNEGIHLFDANGDYIDSLITTDRVFSVSWSSDDTKLAAYTSDRRISIWDVSSRTIINDFEEEFATKVDYSIHWHPQSGNNTIVTQLSSSGMVYDSLTGTLNIVLTVENPVEPISTLVWNEDGTRIFTRSDDDRIRIWDVVNDTVVDMVHIDGSESLQLSPDGDFLAVGNSYNVITILDADTFDVVETLHGLPDIESRFSAVRWSNDGTQIAGSGYQRIIVWDVSSGEIINTITVLDEPFSLDEISAVHPEAVDFGPDNILTYVSYSVIINTDTE